MLNERVYIRSLGFYFMYFPFFHPLSDQKKIVFFLFPFIYFWLSELFNWIFFSFTSYRVFLLYLPLILSMSFSEYIYIFWIYRSTTNLNLKQNEKKININKFFVSVYLLKWVILSQRLWFLFFCFSFLMHCTCFTVHTLTPKCLQARKKIEKVVWMVSF